jgi:hypothetical protein
LQSIPTTFYLWKLHSFLKCVFLPLFILRWNTTWCSPYQYCYFDKTICYLNFILQKTTIIWVNFVINLSFFKLQSFKVVLGESLVFNILKIFEKISYSPEIKLNIPIKRSSSSVFCCNYISEPHKPGYLIRSSEKL